MKLYIIILATLALWCGGCRCGDCNKSAYSGGGGYIPSEMPPSAFRKTLGNVDPIPGPWENRSPYRQPTQVEIVDRSGRRIR